MKRNSNRFSDDERRGFFADRFDNDRTLDEPMEASTRFQRRTIDQTKSESRRVCDGSIRNERRRRKKTFGFQLVLERIKTKKINDITKREQILIEALREYEHRLSQTGFENDIEVFRSKRKFSSENNC